jgi:cytochrome c biogenesis protein CcdA/thiol-disulfide isomerase/thioredoxin
MALIFLVFLGGALTILSPCILPVLPFVFARAEQPFLRNGLPMLAGMALTFAAVATLAAVGGAWAVLVNHYGRLVALVVLGLLALTLLSSTLADRLARPFVALGNRLADASSTGILRSVLLGVATGLLWAPCAGPILGLALTGAAISGPSTRTTLLLLAYAVGAASSLAIALLAGRRLLSAMKKSLGAGLWIRRGLGVAVLVAVVVIASGWDTGAFTRWSIARTDRLEQALVSKIDRSADAASRSAASGARHPLDNELPNDGALPSPDGATAWLNSPPLTPAQLQGKVVLVDFWTYSCINCLRSLPYVKAWYDKYKDHGLIVIGVHSPEFAFEKELNNVRRASMDLGIIRQLLSAGATDLPPAGVGVGVGVGVVRAAGVEASADIAQDHGVDVDAADNGTVRAQRLYQLVRQSKDVHEHEFSIQFLDPGATVYAFTFG